MEQCSVEVKIDGSQMHVILFMSEELGSYPGIRKMQEHLDVWMRWKYYGTKQSVEHPQKISREVGSLLHMAFFLAALGVRLGR